MERRQAKPAQPLLVDEPRIRVMGRLSVGEGDDHLVLPASRKTRALLAYLSVESSPQSRSWLSDLLWDGPRDPRAALRWSLAKLRPLLDELEGVDLETDRDTVALVAEPGAVDIHHLEMVDQSGPAGAFTGSLIRVSELWRGVFLESLDLSGCNRFDAWRTEKREWARRVHVAAVQELIGRLADQPERALLYAMEWMTREPLSEGAHVHAVRLLAELGRLDEAADLSERAVLMMEREFGASPSPELSELRRRLARSPHTGPSGDPRYEVAAARRAVNEGMYEEASTLIAAIMGQLRAGDTTAYLDMAELYVHPAMAPHRPPDLTAQLVETVQQATAAGRMEEARRALYLIANLHYQAGDFELAYQHTTQAERAGRAADGAAVVHSIADTARCLAMLERDIPTAEQLAEEAQALESTLDEPLIETAMAFGLIRRHQGHHEQAARHFERALEIVRVSQDDWWESYCLMWLLIIQLESGAAADALVTYGALHALVRNRPPTAEIVFSRILADVARRRLGDPAREPVDTLLDRLRVDDAGWMLAYALLAVAEEDQASGDGAAAKARAEEARAVATTAGRQGEARRAERLLHRLER